MMQSIRARLLLIALMPALVLAAVLLLHHAGSRFADGKRSLEVRGEVMARQLARAAEFGVASGDRELLRGLVQGLLREADVVRVRIEGVAGGVLAQGSGTIPADGVIHPFVATIAQTEIGIEDFPQAPQAAGTARVLGQVRLELSDVSLRARERAILVESAFILVLGLLLTNWVARALGHAVARPIQRLTDTMGRITSGDLSARVPTGTGGEIGRLEHGLNLMVEALAQARAVERQRSEDALLLERVRAQTVLESIGDGVIVADAAQAVTYINPVAAQLTGWDADSVRGRPLLEVFRVVATDTGMATAYPVDACLHEGSVVRHDNRFALMRRDQRHFPIQDCTTPLRGRDGVAIGVVVVFRDISEIQHLASRMAYLATHDPLTGLVNRHEFEQRLQRLMEQARRDQRTHALCYLDLDQFKIVNDTCGHIAGDELLKQVAHLLQANTRTGDTLARLGGDEFGLLFEGCALEDSHERVEALRRAVKELRFVWANRSFELGVSAGVVPITAESGSMTDVLSAADSACYVAKDLGRNRVHVYQPDDVALSRRHGEMQWVQRLNEALQQDQFVLFGQRIAPVNGGGPEHFFEVLLRLQDGASLVPPTAFLPAAERYYLMPSIDRWVITNTLRVLAQHGDERRLCAINLSGQSLGDEGFLEFVTAALEQYRIAPGTVCFEITETAAVANLTRAVQFIAALKQRGCRFALDDFGSGLSSFGYLKNLPVDYLKIAGSFVQGVANDPVDQAMVEAINAIGHVLGLRTIAESAEDDAIVARLRVMGVDHLQGYAIGRPKPLAEVLGAVP